MPFGQSPCLGANQKARGLWERDCILSGYTRQLLDEVEHDIMNKFIQNRGLCYLLKLKAEADNTDTRF